MTRRNKKVHLSEKLLRDLADLTDDGRRKRYLARHRQLYRDIVVQQLNDLARAKLRIDTRQALSLAEAAVGIARRLRNQEALGRSLRSKANAIGIMGDN